MKKEKESKQNKTDQIVSNYLLIFKFVLGYMYPIHVQARQSKK